MQDNIKMNTINARKHSPFPCNGVVCKHTWGVIHGDLKGVFDYMMDTTTSITISHLEKNLFLIFLPLQ